MKNAGIIAISTSAGILAILIASIGNVAIAQEHNHEEYTTDDYKKATDEIEIYMYFEKPGDYYGKAVISVNNVHKTFDFGKYAEDFGSPMKIDYYYYYDRPYESELCLKNLDSEYSTCVDVYRKDKRIDIHMPN